MTAHPPRRLETERLLIRCWQPDDAVALRAALDPSLDHLRPWLPWAWVEPHTVVQTARRLADFKNGFDEGEEFVYGLFEPDESSVIGGIGLHRRVGLGALEIGYWIRVDRTRRGFATEAVIAVTTAGLALPGVDRIEIHCDPRNAPSRRIPERLGYRLVETRIADKTTHEGEPRDTVVYEVTGAEWTDGTLMHGAR